MLAGIILRSAFLGLIDSLCNHSRRLPSIALSKGSSDPTSATFSCLSAIAQTREQNYLLRSASSSVSQLSGLRMLCHDSWPCHHIEGKIATYVSCLLVYPSVDPSSYWSTPYIEEGVESQKGDSAPQLQEHERCQRVSETTSRGRPEVRQEPTETIRRYRGHQVWFRRSHENRGEKDRTGDDREG